MSRREQLAQLTAARVARIRARIDGGERALTHLGPSKVLERGYSITRLEGSAEPLRDAARVHGGQTLTTRLSRGEVRSLVRSATVGPPPTTSEPAPQPSLFDTIEPSGVEPGDQGADHD